MSKAIKLSDPIVRIKGKLVYFEAEDINSVYGLPYVDKP